MVEAMQQQSTGMQAAQRSVFVRLWFNMRMTVRRLFGKKDDPNIYPFF